MFGELDKQGIEQLLSHKLVGRLGCHADGITYVVPLSYAYDRGYIYARTYEGMKIKFMRKNPKVCFQVDDTKELAYWQSVICWGEFEELTEDAEIKQALQKLNDRKLPMLSSETMHITPEWPFPAAKNEKIDGIFFRIRLTEKTGRFEKIVGHEFFAT